MYKDCTVRIYVILIFSVFFLSHSMYVLNIRFCCWISRRVSHPFLSLWSVWDVSARTVDVGEVLRSMFSSVLISPWRLLYSPRSTATRPVMPDAWELICPPKEFPKRFARQRPEVVLSSTKTGNFVDGTTALYTLYSLHLLFLLSFSFLLQTHNKTEPPPASLRPDSWLMPRRNVDDGPIIGATGAKKTGALLA